MALKKGTETRFKDKNGIAIRVGDRIQRDDNSIWTVDHRCYAVSTHGIKLSLANIPLEKYRILVEEEETVEENTDTAPETSDPCKGMFKPKGAAPADPIEGGGGSYGSRG
jgi:hypothetical protein